MILIACFVILVQGPVIASHPLIDGNPKSHAGRRTVPFPAGIVPELADDLKRFADPKPNGLVFIGPKGGRLRRSNFRNAGTGPGEPSTFPNSMERGAFRSWIWSCDGAGGVAIGRADADGWGNLPGRFCPMPKFQRCPRAGWDTSSWTNWHWCTSTASGVDRRSRLVNAEAW